MILLDAAAWAVAAPLALVNAFAALELGLGSARAAPVSAGIPDVDSDVTILIPAHDEAAGIAATLNRLKSELAPNMRILVVADNCTDETAVLARANGVKTIERVDEARRGKGFALAFGRDHLSLSPPAAVIVVDADCVMDAGSLRRLAAAALNAHAPAQAINLLASDMAAPANVQIGAFAFAVKNQIRQLGLKRLGGPALLNGTGMAFPWAIFADAPLASGHLAEDLELGLMLARQECFARLVPGARVLSPVSSTEGTLSQRRRWERGFLANARQNALPTIARGLVRRSAALVLLGLDLLVPPLALLVVLTLAGLAGTTLFHLFGASQWPTLTLGIATTLFGFALAGAWLRCGRIYLSAATLIRLPLYVAWKIPVYAGMLARKPPQWTRTERP